MIDGINHITLSVVDIGTSFLFYRDVLGFKPVMRSPFSAYFTFGGIWLALVEEKSANRENDTYAHIALNLVKKDFRTMVERLVENGVVQWQENRSEGESFYFLDPSGNRFELHYSTLEARVKHGKEEWDGVEWFV